MTSGFGLVVRFTLRDAAAALAFDELVSQTLDGIRKHEAGTVAYLVHRVPDEPDVRVFYELYESRTAFDAHEQQPHTCHFLAEREKFVLSTDVTFLELADGKRGRTGVDTGPAYRRG
ncbi:antibiotic biosynthesis monooxygenase [Streptomyces cinnamoneus]|uniref:Antibiotic biosynthesis monooxygenase n=1 Tax=Streptomyces cinnamoneus TaxID=53446 RepID=A0A2G1XG53_STRCJ|nr:antibiotic biosynthesis monooxygenase [Streptomyces cinnamoneus]PHQ50214.1 antibiotic biosynthesis monooxygenase [Streptomyces cinnamoneus]PPT13002.1 antibiotic biosynthesis monooxygenase [Streptomyces cinnamoneus]